MKKFLLALVVVLCCASASRAENKSPEVPLGDAAYADLELFNSSAESACEDCQFEITRAITRYEFAVGVARLSDQIERNEENKRAGAALPSFPVKLDMSKAENLAAFQRLVEKFRPELEQLGIKVNTLRINGVLLIDPKTAPPFADVPKDHWAFEAVEKLRLSGIVVGLPDGY
jgi:hypothetical protein